VVDSINAKKTIKKIRRGLSIYRTGRSPFWHARIYDPVKKKYVVRSTKETNRIEEYGEDSPEVSRANNIINTRRGTTVNRYLKAANDYLENVGKGKFPLRSSKDKNKTAD